MQSSVVDGPIEDFWNPSTHQQAILRTAEDFWSPLNRTADLGPSSSWIWEFDDTSKQDAPTTENWEPRFLPWFDVERAENPRVLVFSPPTAEDLAIRRGRWISLMLDIPDVRNRRRCIETLAEVFDRFPSRAAFQALADIALGGVAFDDFLAGCRFRLDFIDHPYFAVGRHGRQPPTTPADPQTLLSWPRAVRLAELAGGDPMHSIDDDWLAEWRYLRPDHQAYWSFVDYIEWRLRAASRFSSVHFDLHPNIDRIKFRGTFGAASLQSRTAALVRVDRGHMGVLYPDPGSLVIPRRVRT